MILRALVWIVMLPLRLAWAVALSTLRLVLGAVLLLLTVGAIVAWVVSNG